MKRKVLALLSVSFFMLGTEAITYAGTPGFYLGGAVAASFQHNKKQTLQTGGGDGFPSDGTETVSPSNRGVGERFFLGYNLNNYFGLEGGFTHYAPTTYKVPADPELSIGNPTGNPAITANGFDFVAKGMLPIFNSGVDVVGKAGFAIIGSTKAGTFSTTYNDDEGVNVTSNGATNYARPTAAIGVSYDFSQSWTADFTESHVFGGGGLQSLDLLSLGLSYHFSDKYCGQFLC
jgi:hypothetical protein